MRDEARGAVRTPRRRSWAAILNIDVNTRTRTCMVSSPALASLDTPSPSPLCIKQLIPASPSVFSMAFVCEGQSTLLSFCLFVCHFLRRHRSKGEVNTLKKKRVKASLNFPLCLGPTPALPLSLPPSLSSLLVFICFFFLSSTVTLLSALLQCGIRCREPHKLTHARLPINPAASLLLLNPTDHLTSSIRFFFFYYFLLGSTLAPRRVPLVPLLSDLPPSLPPLSLVLPLLTRIFAIKQQPFFVLSMPLSHSFHAVVLLAACVLVAAHAVSAISSADCSSYVSHFPYAITSTDCIMKNMCYTRILCCSTADTTELNQCIDSTTFTCNLTAVCASHAEDESWYPYTINNGLSVSCCQDGYTTTPAPAVPDFGFSDESDEDYVLRQGPLPQRTCDDSTSEGCVATNHFPSLVRAFCQDAIPPSYTNDYILQSAPHICCKYATAPASTKAYDSAVGTVKCGMDLLDLPRIGEFHCSMVGRAETICCNGVISSTVAEDSTATDSALGDNYTYTGNTCLFVPDIGDSAKYSDLSSVALVTVAAVTVMIDSF